MKAFLKTPQAVTFALACAALCACTAGGNGTGTDIDGLNDAGTAGAGSGGNGASDAGAAGGDIIIDGSAGGGDSVVAEVYGHSATELYKLDPLTLKVTKVDTFSGCTNVLDLAIDKDHNVFGTTFEGLYRIDKNDATCTPIRLATDYPNSLSFVPAGTIDPDEEVLVGYYQSDYVRIDPNTGIVTTGVGGLSGGYVSSGDIVSVIGGGTYLTIKGNDCGSAPNYDDCLVEVNPQTGAVVKDWGPVPYYQVFGLAFWGGKAYGFATDGKLFEIHFGLDTVACSEITVSGLPAGFKWWGAGSSTSAPLKPPT